MSPRAVLGRPPLDDAPGDPLSVIYQRVADLKPNPNNARTHGKKQIRQLAESIRVFGFTNPVLVDDRGRIVAGHGRVEAAKRLGLETVPTIRLADLSEDQVRAYTLADNRLAQNSAWDRDLLATELQVLADLDLQFDVSVTGFEAPEIDLLIGEQEIKRHRDPADECPAVEEGLPPVSRPGDVWVLGEHRLLCGDATDTGAFEALMGDERAQLVFVDPPYNVPVSGHVCGLGRVRHREFAMASGEMSSEAFATFLARVFALLARFSVDGAIQFVCMDWRHMGEVLTAGDRAYGSLRNLCVWNKDNGGMGSLYRSKHELVFVFKAGTAPHVNNVELGRHGRNRTNVWDYAGVNSLRAGRMDDLEMHPTVKPTALVADAIQDCSERQGVVLDCFGGSGTTLMAAEKTGRRARVMELDPRYVDVAVKRWGRVAKAEPLHAGTGRPFDEVARARRAEGGSNG